MSPTAAPFVAVFEEEEEEEDQHTLCSMDDLRWLGAELGAELPEYELELRCLAAAVIQAAWRRWQMSIRRAVAWAALRAVYRGCAPQQHVAHSAEDIAEACDPALCDDVGTPEPVGDYSTPSTACAPSRRYFKADPDDDHVASEGGITSPPRTLTGIEAGRRRAPPAAAGAAWTPQPLLIVAAEAALERARGRLRDRVGTLVAGRRMLREGGAAVERALLAKRALAKAACADARSRACADEALEAFHDAITLLARAARRDCISKKDRDAEMDSMAEVYVERAQLLRRRLGFVMAQPPLEPLQLSPVERDALALLKAKRALAGGVSLAWHAVSNHALTRMESLRAMEPTGARTPGTPSATFDRAPAGDGPEAPATPRNTGPPDAQASPQPELSRARTLPELAAKAVKDRLESAQEGGRLLASEPARAALLAKRAAGQAAEGDARLASQVREAAAALQAASTAFQRAAAASDCPLVRDLEGPALLLYRRADKYESLVSVLGEPVQSPVLNAAERDALVLVQMEEAGTSALLSAARSVELGSSTVRRALLAGAKGGPVSPPQAGRRASEAGRRRTRRACC